MEIEARQGEVAKKLWKMVRVLLFIITKGFTLILKRGKLAGKDFINTLMLNRQLYYSSFTCRSRHNGNSFISPLEFEFSCSNTPLHYSSRSFNKSRRRYKDVFIRNNNNNVKVKNSSLDTLSGFGKNHVERELRVTDSPFQVKDEGNNYQVDMAAEEFINNFYKQLNRQNRSIATYE